MATPEVLALLADGRALVTQRFWDQRLVRLWTVSTNGLETLFTTSPPFSWLAERLSVSDDGRYVFEILIDPQQGEATGVRVFDLGTRQFTTAAPVPVAAAAVSSNGRALLDRNLRRFTRDGQPDFDFAPLVATVFPDAPSRRGERLALSPTGSTIAVGAQVSLDSGPSVVVARQDGRVVTLADSPPNLRECGDGTLSFSPDERFLLALACGTGRVWDLDSGTAVVSADTGLYAAAFTKTGSRLVTADATGVIERDLDGANPITWAVDGGYPFVLGSNAVLGHRGEGTLVVLARGKVVGTWRHPNRTWPRAVAVTGDTSFTIIDDWDAPPVPHYAPMLARFAANRAGPTATLSTSARQSKWEGQLALSPDGRRLAVVFPDSVRIVDIGTLAVLTSLDTEAGAIAWSPDGRYLAATPSIHDRDPGRVPYQPARAVALWEAGSGALVASFTTAIYPRGIAFDDTGGTIRGWGSDLNAYSAPDSGVTSFFPEGENASFKIDLPTGVVTPTRDAPFVGNARDLVAEEGGIFRVSTGAALATFVSARRAAFSGDLSLVLVTSDWESRLFAVEDGRLVAQLPSLGSSRDPLALSHDGRRLVVDQAIWCLGR